MNTNISLPECVSTVSFGCPVKLFTDSTALHACESHISFKERMRIQSYRDLSQTFIRKYLKKRLSAAFLKYTPVASANPIQSALSMQVSAMTLFDPQNLCSRANANTPGN